MCRVNGRKQTSYWNRGPVSNASQSSWKAPRRGVATLPRQTIRLWPVVFLQTSLNSPQASFMAIFSRRIPWKADIKRRLLRDCNKLPISEDPVSYHHRYSFGFAIFLSFSSFFFFFFFLSFKLSSPLAHRKKLSLSLRETGWVFFWLSEDVQRSHFVVPNGIKDTESNFYIITEGQVGVFLTGM